MTLPILPFLLACSEVPSLAPAPAEPIALVGLAASSLTEVLPKVAEAWKADGGQAITFSFDASSRLARQVEAEAPVDLVFFADQETMDDLSQKSLILPETRRILAGNTLVLVVPAGASWKPASVAELAAPALAHLAIAGENVPAGRYARAALSAVGLWTAVEPGVVSGDSVRTTLAWVSRDEAEAGVVYATDARVEPEVEVAFTFPADSHPPIDYPAAVVARSSRPEPAAAFLAFCASARGQALFAEAGFAPPPR